MDRVFSARLDVDVADELERACRLLRITKKRFLEQAIQRQVRHVAPEAAGGGHDSIWERT
jgi:predicted transcriptional regulator